MAFSMKQVKAKLQEYGVPAENLDAAAEYFCAAHKTSLDAIKEERDAFKADAEKLPGVQTELEALKSKPDDGYKEKYEKEHRAFEDYKAGISAKEAKAAKEKAVRAFYESKNIKGASLEIAMRGSAGEIDGLELDEKGNIKDAKALEALVSGTFAGLVTKETTVPQNTPTPPTGSASAGLGTSRAAQLYAEHYKSLYGEQKGTES